MKNHGKKQAKNYIQKTNMKLNIRIVNSIAEKRLKKHRILPKNADLVHRLPNAGKRFIIIRNKPDHKIWYNDKAPALQAAHFFRLIGRGSASAH